MSSRILGYALIVLLSAGVLSASLAPAHAKVFDDLPDAIVCSVNDPTGVLPWDELVFYVSARIEGGVTLYKSLTSNPVLLMVAQDREVSAPNLADCDGRRTDELRAAGRAFDYH